MATISRLSRSSVLIRKSRGKGLAEITESTQRAVTRRTLSDWKDLLSWIPRDMAWIQDYSVFSLIIWMKR